MNKLTEIKQQYESFTKNPKTYVAILTVEELGYLLSLLEEKDKALMFYEDKENYVHIKFTDSSAITIDWGQIARKALELNDK